MEWEIVYHSESIEQQVFALPDDLKAHYLRLTDLMMLFGPHLKLPHTKAMGSGLFELRLKGREGIARVFYCTNVGRKIVMLHSFIKKSKKTLRRELDTAIKKMNEVKNDAIA